MLNPEKQHGGSVLIFPLRNLFSLSTMHASLYIKNKLDELHFLYTHLRTTQLVRRRKPFLFLAGHLPPISQIERKKKKNPFSLESKLLVQDGMEEEMGSLSAVKKNGTRRKNEIFFVRRKVSKNRERCFLNLWEILDRPPKFFFSGRHTIFAYIATHPFFFWVSKNKKGIRVRPQSPHLNSPKVLT